MALHLRSAILLALIPSVIGTTASAFPVVPMNPLNQNTRAFSDQDIESLVQNGEAEIVRDGSDLIGQVSDDGFELQDLIHRVNQQSFEDSAVQITVNKQNQTMLFSWLDAAGRRQSFETLISTAGGVLKIPDGKMNRRPYCATTPDYDTFFPRVRDGQDIMVNPHHDSGTFDATLPWAFRLTGGIFFHQTPAPRYEKQLGQAMSGGCIRVPARYAKFVWQTIRANGGAYVRVNGPEQSPGQLEHCRKNLLPGAVARWAAKNGQAQSPSPTPALPKYQYQAPAPAPAPKTFFGFPSLF
jgi:hypothetical protein